MGELQLDSLVQQLQAGFLPLCDRCETLLTLRPPFQQLREKGYTIVATTPHKDAYTPQDLPLDKPIALFFGAEKHGISEELSKEADYFVKIPMHGFTESYNVSVSAAILLSALRTRMIHEKIPFILSPEAQINLKIDWCEKILNGGTALAEKYRLEFKKDF